jgi:hypothetical protein
LILLEPEHDVADVYRIFVITRQSAGIYLCVICFGYFD